MKTSMFANAVVGFVGVLALAVVAVFSQVAESPRTPSRKLDHIVAPPRSPEDGARPEENIIKFSKAHDEGQSAIADVLRRQPTPSIRATYFQEILNNPELQFKKWHLTISEVTTVDGVTRVKVRAIPFFRSTAPTCTTSLTTYELRGDALKLIKTDPPVDSAKPKRFTILYM